MSDIIEEVTEIGLDIPKFSVDVEYENVPYPLPKQCGFFCYVGPPRSGKSSLMSSLLCTTKPQKIYSGVFHHVFMIIPKTSYDSMTDSPFKTLSPEKIIHEFTEESLLKVISRLEESTKKKQNSLIIIDDFMSSLKDVKLRKSLEKLIANRRHLRVSVFVVSQNYISIPLSTRKLITAMFMFKCNNLKERDSIRSELVPRDKNEFFRMYNHVFNENSDKHTFMFLDIENGDIFKNFNKLTIK